MALLGGQHQCGAEEGADAGRPAQGEDHAENQRREEVHVFLDYTAFAAPEQVDMEHTKEVQAEEDHDQTGDDIHCSLVRSQEAAYSACQRTEDHKDDAEAGYKTDGSSESLAHAAFAAAREVRNVNGQHRQKTRGNEGDDSFQKSYDILHSLHSFRMCLRTPINGESAVTRVCIFLRLKPVNSIP